jgi:hypothetical protein
MDEGFHKPCDEAEKAHCHKPSIGRMRVVRKSRAGRTEERRLDNRALSFAIGKHFALLHRNCSN